MSEHIKTGVIGLGAMGTGLDRNIAQGTLSVMAGGDSANLSRIMPVPGAISASVTHMGPVSSGQATKAVNQVMIAGIAEAVSEGLALG